MMKWLVRNCRDSDVFAWSFAILGIVLMIVIALW
jgi:hypothetical protein